MGDDGGGDPLVRFETSTGGTLRQRQSMPSDGLTGSGYEGTRSNELGTPGNTYDDVIAISAASVSEFSLSVCIFDYDSDSGFDDVTARNAYVDGLNTENCGLTQTSSSVTSSSVGAPWVGAQSITCPTPNPWVAVQLGFAPNVNPVLFSAENTIGKNIHIFQKYILNR